MVETTEGMIDLNSLAVIIEMTEDGEIFKAEMIIVVVGEAVEGTAKDVRVHPSDRIIAMIVREMIVHAMKDLETIDPGTIGQGRTDHSHSQFLQSSCLANQK
jgi:hypothetical protein